MSSTAKVWTREALLAHTDEVGDCLIWKGKLQNGWPGVYAQARPRREGETLLLAWAGETFRLSMKPIWVQPLAVAISVGQAVQP